jgi:hypothetical protein
MEGSVYLKEADEPDTKKTGSVDCANAYCKWMSVKCGGIFGHHQDIFL